MAAVEDPNDPAVKMRQAAALRAQGMTEEQIETLLGGTVDPKGLRSQYEMSAYLRKGALAPDSSKNVFGALAQAGQGYMAGKSDITFQKQLAEQLRAENAQRRTQFDLARRGIKRPDEDEYTRMYQSNPEYQ